MKPPSARTTEPGKPHPVRAGSLFVVAAPSGAGKTSLVRALLDREPRMQLSVSFTTRAPRPGEIEGRDYFFVDRAGFEQRREDGEFLEWAEVHGNLYATSRRWIEERMAAGVDIVLEIDWQGAVQVQRLYPDAVGIFIAPPSMQALHERLVARGQDSVEVIAQRVSAAEAELEQAHRFQYVIINQDFTRALGELLTIVKAARLRFAQQKARHAETFDALGIRG
ncbi:MAG: guanylate kinase [Lautropia sp. SCN 70-15]|nr:MAG: guanylate kinase [Lautropia sp. SCN 70-15]